MPVSPEQRKILLERLEMARKAKAQKAEGVPNTPAPVERKKIAAAVKAAQPQAPPPPPQPQQHEAEEYDEPPAEEAPPKVWSRPRHADNAPASDQKASTIKKNKYMKVVFYSEPPKSKVENLLKSLDDSEDAAPPAKRAAPPAKRAAPAAAPAKAKPKPAKRQQSAGDDLEELARLYFS